MVSLSFTTLVKTDPSAGDSINLLPLSPQQALFGQTKYLNSFGAVGLLFAHHVVFY